MLRRVLVVDDSELIHKMYQLVLCRFNCELVMAMNGREGLDILAQQDDFQMILLDIHMPVMNGVQFMEEANAQGITDRYPIVILSSEGKEEETARGLKLGARGFLRKPFKSSDLYDIIAKIFPQLDISDVTDCR
ncbi:MAG: response regulator [Deltaproteobacteria bacterium]|nr:response regulator [Deltaproteobacteria bacterium]